MIEFLAKAIEIFKWIKNMLSPIIIALVIDICILILIIGIILGVKLANYLQKM